MRYTYPPSEDGILKHSVMKHWYVLKNRNALWRSRKTERGNGECVKVKGGKACLPADFFYLFFVFIFVPPGGRSCECGGAGGRGERSGLRHENRTAGTHP